MNKQLRSITTMFVLIAGFSVMLLLNSCGPASNQSRTSESAEIDASSTLKPLNVGNVKRIHQIGPYYLASQPGASDFQLLRDEGIKTVINLRPHDETPEMDEVKIVEELGFTYYNVPIDGADGLDASAIDRVRELLRTAERPMLLHCSSANRVGSVWFPYRVLDHNVSLTDAFDEAKTVGLRSDTLEETARAYINERQEK